MYGVSGAFPGFLQGIAFIPDENGTCINGFQVNDSSFCITLYYHELKEKPTEQTLVFNASTSLNYTKVEHDRTNTPSSQEQIMNCLLPRANIRCICKD